MGTMTDAADDAAKALVNRFEMESMALHKIQRQWLEREIANLYRTTPMTRPPSNSEAK